MSIKSVKYKSENEVVSETSAQEDILNQSENFAVKIMMLRYSLVFILVGLATGLGAGSFVLLRYRELSTFKAEYQSASIQAASSITGHIQKTYIAATLINDIYATELSLSGESLPYYTQPSFDKIVNGINLLTKSRITSFSPLISSSNRLQWEKYARDNVGLLQGPPSLEVSTNGSWIVADGIFIINSQGKPVPSPSYSSGSLYPDLMFPIWQVAPLLSNAAAVMFDPHAKINTRMKAIDQAISTMQGASTDIVQLVVDNLKFRPSTILYYPITDPGNSTKPVGLLGIAFTWDEIFTNILPSYLNRIDCVVSTAKSTFTLAIDNGAVTILGVGDLHNRMFDQYKAVISEGLSDSKTSLAGYTITLYPTDSLYTTYITTYPQNVCIGAVVIIAFTALVFTLYVSLVNMRQAKLEEAATRSLVRDTTRDAVLQSKKIYVRYISHEMRTPLNVAFLGLKFLSKDLLKDENPANSDRVDTVNDISKACHMALSILNDLLNYDKLEDGTLLIEPMRVVALPFILNCTEVLHLQAKEKGLRLTFDVENKDDINEKNLDGMRDPEYPHFGCLSDMDAFACTDISPTQMSCLSDSDYINVDPYKMNQVIGNLISNAIKFTPSGQSVTVKARKFVPDARWSSYPASHQSSQAEMSLSEDSRSNSYLRRVQEYFTFYSSEKKSDEAKKSEKKEEDVHAAGRCLRSSAFFNFAPNNSGFLILEVIDSGVGMAPEDSKRLFKEIVQFNPSKLQAGGGSGLGMMIAKGIVDLHGGEISVYSAGEGHGCTFTVKIPLMDTPALTRDVSVADEDLRQSLSRRSSYVHGCLDFAKMHAHNVSFASLVSLSGEINSLVESNQLSQSRGGNGVVDSDGQSEYCVDGSMRSGTLTAPQSPLRNPTALAFSDQNPLCIPVSVPLPLPSPFFFAKDYTRNDSTHFDILIVDDSKLNRKMLAKSLKASCHRCEEAEDGVQAVEMVKLKWSNEGGMYDVILMDFMMPRMDGPTATEILRDMGYRGIIIGVTGNALPSDIKHFTAKGANRVFLKPVDVDALQSALLSLLNPC